MLIPVNKVFSFRQNTYTVFDTDLLKFYEVPTIEYIPYELPVMDGASCEIMQNDAYVKIGRIDDYVVLCDNGFLFYVKDYTNLTKAVVGYRRNKLPILNYDIDNDKFEFLTDVQGGMKLSIKGEGKKFYGRSKETGREGIVKFPLHKDSRDFLYEKVYYDYAMQIGVPCVPAEIGCYMGRVCCLSVFLRKPEDDWRSFMRIYSTDNTQTELAIVQNYGIEQQYMHALLLDYVLCNSDRHMGNLAIMNNKLYPMFDNGRILGIAGNNVCAQNHNKFVEQNIKSYDGAFMKRVFALRNYINPLMCSTERDLVIKRINRLEMLYNG